VGADDEEEDEEVCPDVRACLSPCRDDLRSSTMTAAQGERVVPVRAFEETGVRVTEEDEEGAARVGVDGADCGAGAWRYA
jgi:hypothetical protein